MGSERCIVPSILMASEYYLLEKASGCMPRGTLGLVKNGRDLMTAQAGQRSARLQGLEACMFWTLVRRAPASPAPSLEAFDTMAHPLWTCLCRHCRQRIPRPLAWPVHLASMYSHVQNNHSVQNCQGQLVTALCRMRGGMMDGNLRGGALPALTGPLAIPSGTATQRPIEVLLKPNEFKAPGKSRLI